MRYGALTLQEAKERLRIHELWRLLDLPGKPSTSCHCPWRDDKHPSFSVRDDGMLWHDFATGEGGDNIDFFKRSTRLEGPESYRKFIELAGGAQSSPLPANKRITTGAQVAQRPLPQLPAMRKGTPEELSAVAALRNIHPEAANIAGHVGWLRFGQYMDAPAWFILDASGRVAQARRMDGQRWPSGAKAHTCAGSWASWAVGAGLGDYPTVVLCEGGPDLLAALHFIILRDMPALIAPVAMLGAGQKMHPEALATFRGKRVRIFPHADRAGQEAAQRWAKQLADIGASVDAFNFDGLRKADGSPVNDLNDCTHIHPNDENELKELLPDEQNN